MATAAPAPPSLVAALAPVAALVGLLGLSFHLFGGDAASGPNQVALTFATLVALYVGWRQGHSIEALRDAAVTSVDTGIGAIFILLAVGALIGTWAMSGTLAAMVWLGLQFLSPAYLYLSACLICGLTGLVIGSSWTVAGTLGIGLIGIAQKMGLDPAITAGAVISGAYFGDKSSPLSGTANLACAAAGAELFTHIREALWTSLPALAVAAGVFWWLGTPATFDTAAALAALEAAQAPGLVHLAPLALVLGLALLRWPAFTTIFLGALAGAALAVIAAPERVAAFAGDPGLPLALALVKGVWQALAAGYVSATGEASVDALLSRGGMASMLPTVWLIITAFAFGGVVEKAGVLDRLICPLIAAARSAAALVATLVASCVATNALASDQYIAVVLPGRLFRRAFAERGLAPVVLSRGLGDGAAVTSPLIPWNSCGAYMSATLGVATAAYAPSALFNLLNPLVALAFAALGLRLLRSPDPPAR